MNSAAFKLRFSYQSSTPEYKKKTLLLIGVAFFIHLVLAAIFQLGNDEAYYWFYSRRLQWNYFDHPPLVAVWSKLFSFNLQNEVFVRLGSIVGAALATWFIYRCVAELHSERAGWYAAVLYNTSFYAAIMAGVFIMPDAPQMIFWTLSMWMVVRINKNENNWWPWIIFGAASGLCIMSKVHGAFLWIGFLLFCIFHKRHLLKMPQLYVALFLTICIASPIFIWNFQNDFVTYKFHSERVTILGAAVNHKNFVQEFIGQVLFNNPFNVLLTVFAIIHLKKRSGNDKALSFFKWTGVTLAILLLVVSLFRSIYPHWSGPAYVSLIPLAAVYLAETQLSILPSWLKRSIGGFIVFVVMWPLITHYFPGTYGSKKDHNYGWSDVTLDRYGWQEAGKSFASFYKQQVSDGTIPPSTSLICNTWWGAHVEYYFAKPAGITMIGLGSVTEIHHYAWTNSWRKNNVNMQQAFAIVPSDEFYDVRKAYGPYFQKIVPVRKITIYRLHKKARSFTVYHCQGWKDYMPAVP